MTGFVLGGCPGLGVCPQMPRGDWRARTLGTNSRSERGTRSHWAHNGASQSSLAHVCPGLARPPPPSLVRLSCGLALSLQLPRGARKPVGWGQRGGSVGLPPQVCQPGPLGPGGPFRTPPAASVGQKLNSVPTHAQASDLSSRGSSGLQSPMASLLPCSPAGVSATGVLGEAAPLALCPIPALSPLDPVLQSLVLPPPRPQLLPQSLAGLCLPKSRAVLTQFGSRPRLPPALLPLSLPSLWKTEKAPTATPCPLGLPLQEEGAAVC